MYKTVFDFEVKRMDGTIQKLSDYRGKVVLIVNTASECGFTPQYKGLEALWQKYQERGLVILGFPCNQFGGQEPGSDQEIATFCERSFGVSFPLFSKVDVNGPGAEPLFQYLTSSAKGILGTEKIKWNFTKFLVSPDGQQLERFASATAPEKLEGEIEKLLSKS